MTDIAGPNTSSCAIRIGGGVKVVAHDVELLARPGDLLGFEQVEEFDPALARSDPVEELAGGQVSAASMWMTPAGRV